MKNLFWIIVCALLVPACTKDEMPIFKPEAFQEDQQKVDTVYTGLDAMAADNGYTSIPQLLEKETWYPGFEQKFLIRHPTDTFYYGTFESHSAWGFHFDPWPFNTSEISRLNSEGHTVRQDFEPFPKRFEIPDGPDYLIFLPTRYTDSTLSFELKRETLKDSITTLDYLKLETRL